MTLLPGSYQIAAWWHGAAGSGKSTLAECVEGVHNKVARLDRPLWETRLRSKASSAAS